MRLEELALQVQRQGFCVLEAVYSAEECARMAHLLDHYIDLSGPADLAGFGAAIHPLLHHIPEFGPYFANSSLNDALREVLQDDVRLRHSGARISSEESTAMLDWHQHYAWTPEGVLQRSRPERVLANVYLEGLSPEVGSLIVLPRRLNDAIVAPLEDRYVQWPGQVVVSCPPGSVVIFDTALWHSALRGTRPGRRRLWGGHFQGASNPRPHPEDNAK